MKNTLNAFMKIGESFKELFSAVKEDMGNAQVLTQKENTNAPVDEREKYVDKTLDSLTRLLMLTADEKANIPGYVSSEDSFNGGIFRKFLTKDYAILSCKDNDYNPNFSKFDLVLLDDQKNVILKKSTIYDINCHDTEVVYESSPKWKEQAGQLIDRIEQDISDTRKNTAIAKIKQMQENMMNNSNKSTFKPA